MDTKFFVLDQFRDSDCVINAKPVLILNDLYVYKLFINPEIPSDIILTKKGQENGISYDHVALNSMGEGFIYDFENRKCRISLGQCHIT